MWWCCCCFAVRSITMDEEEKYSLRSEIEILSARCYYNLLAHPLSLSPQTYQKSGYLGTHKSDCWLRSFRWCCCFAFFLVQQLILFRSREAIMRLHMVEFESFFFECFYVREEGFRFFLFILAKFSSSSIFLVISCPPRENFAIFVENFQISFPPAGREEIRQSRRKPLTTVSCERSNLLESIKCCFHLSSIAHTRWVLLLLSRKKKDERTKSNSLPTTGLTCRKRRGCFDWWNEGDSKDYSRRSRVVSLRDHLFPSPNTTAAAAHTLCAHGKSTHDRERKKKRKLKHIKTQSTSTFCGWEKWTFTFISLLVAAPFFSWMGKEREKQKKICHIFFCCRCWATPTYARKVWGGDYMQHREKRESISIE